MKKLLLIGIGPGHPEQITVQAIRAMNEVDVFFFLEKQGAKKDLLRIRKEICDRYITSRTYRVVESNDPERDTSIADYTTRVEQWHEQRADIYERLIAKELGDNECGGILVWGDASLYDSALRIVDTVLARGHVHFEHEVIPGITSIQALAARHKIVLNGIGESLSITTGRQLVTQGLREDETNILVMLDGGNTFRSLPADDLHIYWSACLGTENEVSISGPLADVAEQIEQARTETKDANGWIMDLYLLRRNTKKP